MTTKILTGLLGLLMVTGVAATGTTPEAVSPTATFQGAAGDRSVAQELPAAIKTRLDAFVRAVVSGDVAAFERMAQEHYTPEYLAQRTPAQRKEVVDRIRGDFGTLAVRGIQVRDAEPIRVGVRGSTGLPGFFDITIEPAPPHRIARVSMRAGSDGIDSGRPGAGSSPAVRPTMTPAELTKAIDDYLAPRAVADTFAGVVLVAKDGMPVYEKAFGLADRDKRVPITPATRFNIGSINKLLTKIAIALLVAQGSLPLSDTIGKLLPDYPNAEAKGATVEQLLDHKAGIVNFFGPEFAKTPKSRFRSNADYYAFVAPKPLLFPPGTRTEYCNGCYVVLGAIIERVSGQRYEDYVMARVVAPARMKGAGFFHSDRFPNDVATGYTREGPDGGGPLRSNEQLHGVAGSAAGGAYATAADLLALDTALRERKLADAASTAWILNAEAEAAAGPRVSGARAWAGGAPGCNAFLDSDGTWTVAVVGNLDPPNAMQVGEALARALRR